MSTIGGIRNDGTLLFSGGSLILDGTFDNWATECEYQKITDEPKAYYPDYVDYVKCTYCGSHCVDQRGNCGACGAPLE